MPDLHVSAHAISRYRERVRPCTEAEARLAMSSARIAAMIAFGARLVKLGTGHRLIIRDGTIVTVTPAETQSRNWLDRMTRSSTGGNE